MGCGTAKPCQCQTAPWKGLRMNNSLHAHFARRMLAAAAATLCLAPAWAAEPSTSAAQQTYAHDRAACLSSSTAETRETCLKEAGAARAEARKGKLSDPDQATLKANALRRCEAVQPADRHACEEMALGGGTVSGSVEGGGVLRQYVTIEPAE